MRTSCKGSTRRRHAFYFRCFHRQIVCAPQHQAHCHARLLAIYTYSTRGGKTPCAIQQHCPRTHGLFRHHHWSELLDIEGGHRWEVGASSQQPPWMQALSLFSSSLCSLTTARTTSPMETIPSIPVPSITGMCLMRFSARRDRHNRL